MNILKTIQTILKERVREHKELTLEYWFYRATDRERDGIQRNAAYEHYNRLSGKYLAKYGEKYIPIRRREEERQFGRHD
jgi:hypothetical protein